MTANGPPVASWPSDDEFAPLQVQVEDPDGQVYLVRAVRRGMPLRPISATGDQGLVGVFVLILLEVGARRLDGWVVGVLRDRGWRAAKTIHKERAPTSAGAKARFHELAQAIETYGAEIAIGVASS